MKNLKEMREYLKYSLCGACDDYDENRDLRRVIENSLNMDILYRFYGIKRIFADYEDNGELLLTVSDKEIGEYDNTYETFLVETWEDDEGYTYVGELIRL